MSGKQVGEIDAAIEVAGATIKHALANLRLVHTAAVGSAVAE